MNRQWILLLISVLIFAGCDSKYELGDYYKSGDTKGIVVQVDAEGNPLLILSLFEAENVDADSAQNWVATLEGEGWQLPDKGEMEQINKYKSLINKTLERKGMPTILKNHTFYWTATPCSESHTYACGPDGTRCYFNQNASPLYRSRAVKKLK